MKRLTVSLSDEDYYRLRGRVRTEEAESKSDALRQMLEEGEDLRGQCEDLHRRCERLQNEKETLIEDREERHELREYVEEEKSAVERREELKDEPVWRRAKVWVLGREERE